MEDRSRTVGEAPERRVLALADDDGGLRCPLCSHITWLPPKTRRVTLRVFDSYRGHLMGHDPLEWVEALHARR